jgi:hypothetical protein
MARKIEGVAKSEKPKYYDLYFGAGISHFRTMCQLKTMLSGGIC